MKALFFAVTSLLLVCICRGAVPDQASTEFIQQVELIHFSHTDYGFTDHPAVCRDMQRRYLDIALEAAEAASRAPDGARFKWTAETTVAVNDWWQSAAPARREQLLQAIRTGQIEVTALPFNNTPFLNRAQWQTMVRWLPEEIHKVLPRKRPCRMTSMAFLEQAPKSCSTVGCGIFLPESIVTAAALRCRV